MNVIRSLVCGAAAAFAAAGAPAWAQRLDAQTLKLFGGNYSSDCGSSAAPRLRVVADALMVEQGNKRMTGNNVQASYSFFGQSPPPGYQVALLSEVRAQLQMIFIVCRDTSGQYIIIDGDPKVRTALGKGLLDRKYRSCNPTQQAAAPTAPTPAPQKYSETEISAPGLLSDPKFKSAYYKALGALVQESWLAKLDGPSPTNKKVKVAGTDYLLASACKDHDCADNNTVLLYSSAQGVVYGKVYRQRGSTLIGAPPPAVANELDRLWQAEFRQNR